MIRWSTPNPYNPNRKSSWVPGSNLVGGFVEVNSTPDYTTHTDDYGNRYYVMVDTPLSEELTSGELDDRVEEFNIAIPNFTEETENV